MKETIFKLRKLLLSFVPHRRCYLSIPLSVEELQQKLVELSRTGIVEKKSGFIFKSNILYSVKIIDDNSFYIDGPVGYKRCCLFTQSEINLAYSISDTIKLKLKMRLASREISRMAIVLGLFLCFYLVLSIYVSHWAIFGFIHLIMMSLIWYVGAKINVRIEANKIINILRRELSSYS
jgi:hypothetical protein